MSIYEALIKIIMIDFQESAHNNLSNWHKHQKYFGYFLAV